MEKFYSNINSIGFLLYLFIFLAISENLGDILINFFATSYNEILYFNYMKFVGKNDDKN